MKRRYSASEPDFTYCTVSDEDVREFIGGSHKQAGHHVPLGQYLSGIIKPGDLVLDVGCGLSPLGEVTARALSTRADISGLKIIGVDLMTEQQMQNSAQVPLGKNFHYVRADLNALSPDTNLDPVKTQGECRQALLKLQKFLGGRNPAEAKADVILAGGILHYVGLGKPVDALLSMVHPNGKVVVSGAPDYNGPHKSGRNMADLAKYLAEDGVVKDHYLTGFVLSESGMKETGRKALMEALKKRDREVSPDSWRRRVRNLADDPKDARGGYGVMPVTTRTRSGTLSVVASANSRSGVFEMMPRCIMDGEHDGKYLVGDQEVFTLQLDPDFKPKQSRWKGFWARLLGR